LLFSYTLPTIRACSGLAPVRARPWRANKNKEANFASLQLLLSHLYGLLPKHPKILLRRLQRNIQFYLQSKSATTSSTGGLVLALKRAFLLLAQKGGIASTFTGPL